MEQGSLLLGVLAALIQQKVIDNSTFRWVIESKPLKTTTIVSAPTCVKRNKRWPRTNLNWKNWLLKDLRAQPSISKFQRS